MGCADAVARSPASIRAVTMIVLMISDIDITFSILFAVQIISLEGLWKYGACVHGIGILTYFAGVLWFGPRQKMAVVKMVKDTIARHPQHCEYDDGPPVTDPRRPIKTLSLDSPLFKDQSQRTPGVGRRTFEDLGSDEEDYEACKAALGRYGLTSVWTWQMIYGAIVISLMGVVKVEILLPLAVSGVSFFLTVANVVMDFATVLTVIDGERLVRDRILQTCESARVKDKQAAVDTRTADLAAIETKYADKRNPADLVTKQEEKTDVMNQYHLAVDDVENQNLAIVETEMIHYRTRLGRLKAIARGKTDISDKMEKMGSLDNYKDSLRPLENSLAKIEAHRQAQLDLVDPVEMSAADYRQKMKEIDDDANEKVETIKEQMEGVKKRFAGMPRQQSPQ